MINANELRTGNLIEFKGRPRKVGLETFTAFSILDGNKDCNPIPLTEEWLMKFGFDVHEDTSYDNQYETRKCFSIGEDNYYQVHFVTSNYGNLPSKSIEFYSAGNHIKELHYVHKLQNIYFELSGQELEIKELKPSL